MQREKSKKRCGKKQQLQYQITKKKITLSQVFHHLENTAEVICKKRKQAQANCQDKVIRIASKQGGQKITYFFLFFPLSSMHPFMQHLFYLIESHVLAPKRSVPSLKKTKKGTLTSI